MGGKSFMSMSIVLAASHSGRNQHTPELLFRD
jgi:hypothetical protein